MNDGGWYEGEWLNRMRDGYGVLVRLNIIKFKNWKNGNIYEGYWKFNKAEGKGKLSILNYKQKLMLMAIHTKVRGRMHNLMVLVHINNQVF